MKRILLYIGIIASVFAVPVKPMNIGKMIPVRVVSLCKENEWLVIQTDTGNKGIGGNTQKALQNLKDTASGGIYLDTAEYLILGEGTEKDAEELRGVLKPSVRLCETAKTIDLAEAVKFLDAHGKLPRLKEWKEDTQLPVLSTFGDSLIFLKKVENKA